MSDYDGMGAVGAAILGFYAMFFGLLILVVVANYVATGITLMRLFPKLGVEPWVAWVPYYNQWKLLEVSGQPGWYVLLVLVPFGSYVFIVFHIIGMYRVGTAFGKQSSWAVLAYFLPWVWYWLLASDQETYRPETYAARGWPPPITGFGSAPAS